MMTARSPSDVAPTLEIQPGVLQPTVALCSILIVSGSSSFTVCMRQISGSIIFSVPKPNSVVAPSCILLGTLSQYDFYGVSVGCFTSAVDFIHHVLIPPRPSLTERVLGSVSLDELPRMATP